MSFSISSPISNLVRTTKKYLTELENINIKTIEDLLLYFPRDYEDRSNVSEISEIQCDKKNVLIGSFKSVRKEKSKTGMTLVKSKFIEEKSQESIDCVWFNESIREKTLPLHTKVMIVGKAKINFGNISLQSPSVQIYDGDLSEGLYPIYKEHSFLHQNWFFRKIHEELLPYIKNILIHNIIPKNIAEKKNILNRSHAIEILHYPKNNAELKHARNTFAFEELFILQIISLQKKYLAQKNNYNNDEKIILNPEMIKDFFKTIPFTPTNAQKISLFEIYKDFEKGMPMQRLLEGDVGSGKTFVATCSMLPILQRREQIAILAPTEILAIQLYNSIKNTLNNEKTNKFWGKWRNTENNRLEFNEINIELLTGFIKGKKRNLILDNLRFGEIDILIGTHAIIEDNVIFKNLKFVIIDEQHRFGVKQREKLIKKGNPHFLQMSATPIPRSLAIVAFGDQDISVLNELPPNRKSIETKVIKPTERRTVELFIDDKITKGEQVFIICPLVEESEHFDELKSATEEYLRLTEHIFPHRKIVLLHGKLKSKEKDEIMGKFKNKEFDILVSTSVIEVGIDIPNASIILIEGAERFGLSQLHQFRGRVGRGKNKSYCFLSPTKQNQNARLLAMEKTQNGFELAEIDMLLRGSGEVFGVKQSGIPDLKMANMMDGRLVTEVKEMAEEFLENNALESYPYLLKQVEKKKESLLTQ
jgi:ATP-dependent DNA helicase RecG